jgi:hypothetical protein
VPCSNVSLEICSRKVRIRALCASELKLVYVDTIDVLEDKLTKHDNNIKDYTPMLRLDRYGSVQVKTDSSCAYTLYTAGTARISVFQTLLDIGVDIIVGAFLLLLVLLLALRRRRARRSATRRRHDAARTVSARTITRTLTRSSYLLTAL